MKPKLNIRNKSADAVGNLGVDVHAALVTNAATFPTLSADTTALDTETTALLAAIEAARQGRIAQQALLDARDAARGAVEKRLRKIAAVVDDVANGDIEVIHLAGLQASNEPTPTTMTQVLNLQVTAGEQEAELLAQWEPVEGKLMYQVQICTDTTMPPTNWVDKLRCSASSCKLNDTLVPGTKVWVRVRAEGANDIGPWSDPAWKRVP